MPLNRPTLNEMLESVREWLSEELLPELSDPAQRYKARIAANVLAIAGREVAQGDALDQLEQQLLSEFIDAQGNARQLSSGLCENIRQRQNAGDPQLLDALERIAMAKLAIDNPRYSTYRDHLRED